MTISIITINYNNAAGLKKTLESIQNQTCKNFEYIVIDGGSTDNSIKLLEQYSSIISYYVAEQDSGIYNAMNKGIKKASGDFCLFLNSGDYFYSNTVIENFLKLKLRLDTIYFTDVQFEKNNKLEKKMNYNVHADVFFFASCYTLNHQNTLIPRTLFLEHGYYDENLKIQSDWYFFLKISFYTQTKFKYIKNICISIYDTSGITAQSKNQELIQTEQLFCIKAIFKNESEKIFKLFRLKNYNKTLIQRIKLILYKIYLKIFLTTLKREEICKK